MTGLKLRFWTWGPGAGCKEDLAVSRTDYRGRPAGEWLSGAEGTDHWCQYYWNPTSPKPLGREQKDQAGWRSLGL